MPRHRKIAKISDGPRANAKPTAVPTNGAEQGVASKVASAMELAGSYTHVENVRRSGRAVR